MGDLVRDALCAVSISSVLLFDRFPFPIPKKLANLNFWECEICWSRCRVAFFLNFADIFFLFITTYQ